MNMYQIGESQAQACDLITGKGVALFPDVKAVYGLHQDGWYTRNEKFLTDRLKKIIKKTDEVPFEGLVNKIYLKIKGKLPSFPKVGLMKYDYWQKKAGLQAAAWYVQHLLDTDQLGLQSRTTQVWSVEAGSFQPRTYLYFSFGGGFKKGSFDGMHFSAPGEHPLENATSGQFNYRAQEKALLKDMRNAVELRLDPWVSEEYLNFALSLADDWNTDTDKHGNAVAEDPINKQERLKASSEAVMELAGRTWFEEGKFVDSGRFFYLNYLKGKTLHGKGYEILNVEWAEAFVLDEVAVKAIKHKMYSLIYGEEVPEEFAVANITDDDIAAAKAVDVWASVNQKELARNRGLNKLAQALEDAENGVPSHIMLDLDFTTSGILFSALAFKSPEMAVAVNLIPGREIVSAHMLVADKVGLVGHPKKVVKDNFSMGALNGESLRTSVKNLAKLGIIVSEDQLMNGMVEAFGECAHNIFNIAKWGVSAVKNEQTVLSWPTGDGFIASHQAKYKSVEVILHVPTMLEERGYHKYTVVTDMPLWKAGDKDTSFLPKVSYVNGRATDLVTKVSGLYANMTHSQDGYVLRCVARYLLQRNIPFVFKHDCFFVPPCYIGILKEAIQVNLDSVYGDNFYMKGMKAIAARIPEHRKVPDLVMYEGDLPNTVYEGTNYLMP